ncbi:hypothetical protein ACRQ4B_17285 [Curtobacterium sp. SP.BCo]|uniref:hypothetical protein n=1 Tax=Curtobacterium sp. SP.BCo TaxID=3435229 RepID=UPI003F7372A9
MRLNRAELVALLPAVLLCTMVAGCTNDGSPPQDQPSPSATDSAAAKRVWVEANTRAEATQAIVTGKWLTSDTAARACRDGVQWVVTRLGPGTDPGQRDAVIGDIEAYWRSLGWRPTRSDFPGDHPGEQITYPAGGLFENGFFVRFRTNENGSSLQIQTPCTPGDVDQLNREKYAEQHTNTPPDIPGASSTPIGP